MKKKKFMGTGVAMVTPFTKENKIDAPALKKLTQHLINGMPSPDKNRDSAAEGGVDYLVPLGTTGESVTLTSDEKRKTIDIILETNNGKIPVVIGIGGNNTANVVSDIEKFTKEFAFDAILSVSPYYNKPSQEGIYQHYKALANSTDKPMIIYNVPPRTSSNILPETTLRLANDFKNIVAIKEAAGSVEQCAQIIRSKPKDFMVLSGDDTLTLPFISVGCEGVISVSGNMFPKEISTMVNYALEQNFSAAQKIHYQFMEITALLFKEGNPAGVKAGLEILGICNKYVRLPLVHATEKLSAELARAIKAL